MKSSELIMLICSVHGRKVLRSFLLLSLISVGVPWRDKYGLHLEACVRNDEERSRCCWTRVFCVWSCGGNWRKEVISSRTSSLVRPRIGSAEKPFCLGRWRRHHIRDLITPDRSYRQKWQISVSRGNNLRGKLVNLPGRSRRQISRCFSRDIQLLLKVNTKVTSQGQVRRLRSRSEIWMRVRRDSTRCQV